MKINLERLRIGGAIACGLAAIWCYGQARFYEGRISATEEISKDLTELHREIREKVEMEEAKKKAAEEA